MNEMGRKLSFTAEQVESLHLDSTVALAVGADSIEKVDLNPFLKKLDFDLGSLITDVSLIALETTDESLLDVIYKAVVTDSNVYIYDRFKGGGLVIFDNKGKFIKRVSYGQGPGEISRLYDIAFDWENKILIAFQHSFLLFFTPDGEFIEQKKLPFVFYNFTPISGGYIFKTLDNQGNGHLGGIKDNTLLVSDKDFKLEYAGLAFDQNNVSYGGFNYLYNNGSTLTITERFVDTIYRYRHTGETNQLYAKYVLNFDEKKLPKDYLMGSMNKFEKGTIQNDYYYYLGEYLETEHHNVFFLMNQYLGLKTIVYRDKNTKNLIGGTHAVYDDVNQIPAMSFPIATSGNNFISIHYPSRRDSSLSKSTFLSDEAKKKLNKLTEDDNPVLVLYKMRDF